MPGKEWGEIAKEVANHVLVFQDRRKRELEEKNQSRARDETVQNPHSGTIEGNGKKVKKCGKPRETCETNFGGQRGAEPKHPTAKAVSTVKGS